MAGGGGVVKEKETSRYTLFFFFLQLRTLIISKEMNQVHQSLSTATIPNKGKMYDRGWGLG